MKLEERLKLFKDRGFKYDPETGIITSPKGNIIKGTTGSRGYLYLGIGIQNKSFHLLGSHFAWYMYYNEIPTVIDHIDRNTSNNKISNLRNITQQKNQFNTAAKGYYIYGNKYRAMIGYNNKNIHLGLYNTPEEAHQAYLDAKKIYHII